MMEPRKPIQAPDSSTSYIGQLLKQTSADLGPHRVQEPDTPFHPVVYYEQK